MSMMQLAHPKVDQLKLGAFRPQICQINLLVLLHIHYINDFHNIR